MIENHERAAQVIEFEGLRFGTGYPTDLDGLIEWHNKCYVLFELKYKGCDMKFGQNLALERLCDDLSQVKPTILILAEHETPVTEDVDASVSVVVKYRYNGAWSEKRKGWTLRQIIEDFIKFTEET